jgi:serine protease Do
MNKSRRFLLCGFLLSIGLLLIDNQSPQQVYAQQQKGGGKQGPPSIRTDPKFLAVFQSAVAAASKSTFRIACDGKVTSLGVAISEDGFILTKASDLTGKIALKTRDGLLLDATIVGVHEKHDLAVLKVNATGFVPIVWTDSNIAMVGGFVASCGPEAVPVAIGIVSVATRDVPPPKAIGKDGGKGGGKGGKGGAGPGPYLGVWFVDHAKGVQVVEIAPNTTAAKLAIKPNDVIEAVADKAVDYDTLNKTIEQFKVGDVVPLKILRGTEELQLEAKLGARPINKGVDQNSMGSRLSNLRSGFPTILQHDSVVLPEDCGGPLVDLDGHVVGINIARAGRVESYAIPTETIRPLLPDLMSGKLAPKKK